MAVFRQSAFQEDGAQLLVERFPGSPAAFAESAVDYYVGIYIVNAEMWNSIKGTQRPEDTVRNILTYSQAYLNAETKEFVKQDCDSASRLISAVRPA